MERTPSVRILRPTSAKRHSKLSGMRLSIMWFGILEIFFDEGLRNRSRERAPVAGILHDDREGDLRVIRGRVGDKPRMIAKLLGHVLAFTFLQAGADILRRT